LWSRINISITSAATPAMPTPAETEPLRVSFYKAVATFVRAYAEIDQNLTEAGYSDAAVAALQKEVEFYSDIRAPIKKHSGEELDIRPWREARAELNELPLAAEAWKNNRLGRFRGARPGTEVSRIRNESACVRQHANLPVS
jgi:hypothetical protein